MVELAVNVSDAVAEVLEQYAQAWNRGDAAGVAALYHENAWFAGSPTGQVVKGREPIQATIQAFMDAGLKTFRGKLVDAEEHGDYGFNITEWEFLGPDGQHVECGTAIAIGLREHGTWKVLRHWSVAQPGSLPPE